MMALYPGQDTVDRLGSLDLNSDGEIINLAIVGSSRFYDFEKFEENVELWTNENGYPDLVIVGGASGVDSTSHKKRNSRKNKSIVTFLIKRGSSL